MKTVSVLRIQQLLGHTRNSYRSLEPDGSFASSKELVTGPYPEPCEHSPQTYTISLNFVLILSTHLCLCLPNVFLFRPSYENSLSTPCYTPYPSLWPTIHHSINTWRGVHAMKILMTLFSPAHCFIPRRFKHSPLHPVLRHPQYMSETKFH
jgi:hypothetical protein